MNSPDPRSSARSAPLTALAIVSLLLALGVLATRWDQHRGAPAPVKEAEPLASRAARRLRDGERLDLNTATQADLELLPRIGPALSARIVAGRPFRTVEELQRVPGIGARTVERLRAFLEAGPEPRE